MKKPLLSRRMICYTAPLHAAHLPSGSIFILECLQHVCSCNILSVQLSYQISPPLFLLLLHPTSLYQFLPSPPPYPSWDIRSNTPSKPNHIVDAHAAEVCHELESRTLHKPQLLSGLNIQTWRVAGVHETCIFLDSFQFTVNLRLLEYNKHYVCLQTSVQLIC